MKKLYLNTAQIMHLPSNSMHALLLLIALLLLLPLSAFANPTAKVDRNRIGLDETFRLTISTNTSSFFGGGPDLSVLNQDFKVLGKNQSSRHSIINGRSESTTEWKISLMAKRVGNIVIPPIKVNDEKTAPIVMKVSKMAPSSAAQGNKIYAEAEFDQQDAYVQSQLIFTLRLISAVNLVNLNVETPQIPQAFVEKLSDSTYEKTINGQHFGVYEIKYAIFPQTSGELSIPPVLFSGAVPLRRNRSVFDPFNDRGKAVRLRSPEANITIKEKAPGFSGSHWLPGKRIQLEESWSKTPDQLQVGESITRTVKMTAIGLMAEQLPPISTLSPPGVKTYPDQPQTQNQPSNSGMVSSRIESTAILPIQAGIIELPAVKVAWWDTNTDSLKIASLPARTIQVASNPDSQVASTAKLSHEPTQPGNGSPATEQPTTTAADNKLVSILSLLSILLTIAWIITLILYWRLLKKLHSTNTSHENKTAVTDSNNEKKAFRALKRSCQQNNPLQARSALLLWANSYWNEKSIRTLENITQLAADETLNQIMQELEQTLYSTEQGKNWNGEKLLALISERRKQPSGSAADNTQASQLQPLYPI